MEVRRPRDITARPRKAGDEPIGNRIPGSSEDNRNGTSRSLGRQRRECAWSHDHVDLERNEFGRKSREPLELPLGRSVFNLDVAALDVTEVTKSLKERLLELRASGGVVPRYPIRAMLPACCASVAKGAATNASNPASNPRRVVLILPGSVSP